jgi:glucose/mannose-6-phosphate isomerase
MNDLMLQLIEGFPDQMKDAIELGKQQSLLLSKKPELVLISGMGGSGIGGKIISQLVAGESKIPVLPNSDYALPECVNDKSLVIICSYSGNTEETVKVMKEAHSRGAAIACITSGGKVLELAIDWDCPHILIPGGQPPRSQFGYSSVMLIFMMRALGILSEKAISELEAALTLVRNSQDEIRHQSKEIAKRIANRVPVLYSDSAYEGVAIRWRQQFNENSKMLCWNSVVPEMNHNELVGWAGGDNRFAALMFRNEDDFEKNKIRMDISKSIISKKSDELIELPSKGNSRIERIYYLVNLGDWISYYLAVERKVDPIVIDEIDLLKSELSKY